MTVLEVITYRLGFTYTLAYSAVAKVCPENHSRWTYKHLKCLNKTWDHTHTTCILASIIGIK